MKNKLGILSLLLSLVALSGLAFQEAKKELARKLPSTLPGGGFLLPNGWTVTPAGKQIPVGVMPLGLALTDDGKSLFVTNNGHGEQSITVIDTAEMKVGDEVAVEKSWLGIIYAAKTKKLYLSGGSDNTILVYDFSNQKLLFEGHIELKPRPDKPLQKTEIFPAGIALNAKEDRLYVANNLADTISVVDTKTKRMTTSIPVGEYPYKCVVSRDGTEIYVSNWGSATVSVVDARKGRAIDLIRVGDHPNDLVLSPNGKRLYVANANLNTVSVIDVGRRKVIETISVGISPKALPGSTPNAVAVSGDGRRLFVANATNNCVAVVNLSSESQSEVEGFIPVGWYPTALSLSPDGKVLYVANGKGGSSRPNPRGPNPNLPTTPATEHIHTLLRGTISAIELPNPETLATYTRQVLENSPYRDVLSERPDAAPPGSPIPDRIGQISPIKYVIYVIKENRTYDQVFGDMREGNGDPNLVLFGEDVTPNQHALAREFVLLDNFYVDAEVSATGHNWSTAAYATDYVEKMWPTQYSHRGRRYDYQGGTRLASPSFGYIWDLCARHNISYRSYGEFIEKGASATEPGTATLPALEGHFDPLYRAFDLYYKDQDRASEWIREFNGFEARGDLPRFQIVALPNDHTAGTRLDALAPRAMVADNDLALGRMIHAVSHSPYWKNTAIFVVEDDAQDGPDHVDAHRTIAFVVSPYARRRFVDSTMYSTTSMLRTMELILGLPPMSQFDASASPMYNSFTGEPDYTPFELRPAKVSLEEKNHRTAYKAQRSMELTLDYEDAAPEDEFNQIIWKAVKGKDSEMPAPVRSAFVHRLPSQKK